MPKLLFDECVSILFRDDRTKLRVCGLRVVDVLGAGTGDPDIEVYAERRKMSITTLDKGLIFQQVKKKRRVHLVNKKTGEILELRTKKVGQLEPKHDPVTHCLKVEPKYDIIRP